MANMGDLKPQTAIREFTIARSAQEVVDELICTLRPDITVILGGPEVSYEADEQEITHLADFVITG
jgi:hypothetical protein